METGERGESSPHLTRVQNFAYARQLSLSTGTALLNVGPGELDNATGIRSIDDRNVHLS
jgi:hypothetical protein